MISPQTCGKSNTFNSDNLFIPRPFSVNLGHGPSVVGRAQYAKFVLWIVFFYLSTTVLLKFVWKLQWCDTQLGWQPWYHAASLKRIHGRRTSSLGVQVKKKNCFMFSMGDFLLQNPVKKPCEFFFFFFMPLIQGGSNFGFEFGVAAETWMVGFLLLPVDILWTSLNFQWRLHGNLGTSIKRYSITITSSSCLFIYFWNLDFINFKGKNLKITEFIRWTSWYKDINWQ